MADDRWQKGMKCWAWNDAAREGQRVEILGEDGGRFTLRWANGRISGGHFRSGLFDQNVWVRAPRPPGEESAPE